MNTKNLATPEHIKQAINRARAMLERGRLVNAAQYAHGVNSCIGQIAYFLQRIEEAQCSDYKTLNAMHDKVMQLGGYLYSLKENL